MLEKGVILLIEDNPDDVELTLRALKRNNISNEIVIAKDGAEAIDYLFSTGNYENRSIADDPILVLLDLKLPKINGLEVLSKMRESPYTELIPVVILTLSFEGKKSLWNSCQLVSLTNFSGYNQFFLEAAI